MNRKLKKLKVRVCAAGIVIAAAGITVPAAIGSLPAESVYAAGDVEINAKNFPDEVFRTYVSKDFDKNGDGKLSEGEIKGCTIINCKEKFIYDLTGIEHFTALEKLDCGNKLSSLDVSKNTKLVELKCKNSELSSLDVSKNTALEELDCGYNNLKTLDVSKNTKLKKLYCEVNNLSSLDVSKNTALEWLVCYYNNLSSLDVSKNTALEGLYCSYNNLSSLNISKNTALKNLNCRFNNLSSLDVSKNTALKQLSCSVTLKPGQDVTVGQNNGLNKTVTWKSTDENVAAFDKNGKIKAKSFGWTIVTASSNDGDNKVSCYVLVKDSNTVPATPLKSVLFEKDTYYADEEIKITATAEKKDDSIKEIKVILGDDVYVFDGGQGPSYSSTESVMLHLTDKGTWEGSLKAPHPKLGEYLIGTPSVYRIFYIYYKDDNGNIRCYYNDYNTGDSWGAYTLDGLDEEFVDNYKKYIRIEDVSLVKTNTFKVAEGVYFDKKKGIWIYIEEGDIARSLTGLAYNHFENCLYYFNNGIHDNSFTGFAKYDEDGKVYYVKNGIVSDSYTSAVLTAAQQKYGIDNSRTIFATTPELIKSSLEEAGKKATANKPYIVYVPQGTYNMPKNLTVPENVTLTAEKNTVFEPATDKNFTQFFTVSGNIYGGTYECKNKAVYGLRFVNVSFKGNNGTIERTNINNAKESGIAAIGSDTRFAFVYNNNINGCGNSGISAVSGGWIAIVSGNKIRNNNGAGINIDHGNVNIIRNNAITGNKGNGIHTNSGGSTTGHKYCHIHKIRCNDISGNGGDGVYIDSKCYVDKIFSKNTIKNNRKNGVSIAANAYINVFAKNTTDGNSASNIYVDGKKAVLNMGNTNTISNAKANNITVVNKGKVNIYGKKNTITNAGNNGILVNDGGILLITGKSNSIKNSAKFGLKLSGGSTARISNTKFSNNGGFAVKVKKNSTLKYDKTCNISEKKNAKNRVSIDK